MVAWVRSGSGELRDDDQETWILNHRQDIATELAVDHMTVAKFKFKLQYQIPAWILLLHCSMTDSTLVGVTINIQL